MTESNRKLSSEPTSWLDHLLLTRKILITSGTGGVGKTTVSAALAVRAALLGRKAIVVTIDPAKRLATSLGLSGLGNDPMDLSERLDEAIRLQSPELRKGLPAALAERPASGHLFALMPNAQETFERFVGSLSSHPAITQRVINNPIFQIFSKEFSGANEYMALQRLLALYKTGDYDCIILDTPPSRNALAFLEAPQLLAQFFDEKMIRWLVMPANKIVAIGMKKALGLLEKLTGAAFMTHLFEFASALFDIRLKFQGALHQVTDLLKSKEVGFLMVSNPSPDTTSDIFHFLESLGRHGFHFEGLVFNRTHLTPWDRSSITSEIPESSSVEHAKKILSSLSERQTHAIQTLTQYFVEKAVEPNWIKLPELARDVHHLNDLLVISQAWEPVPCTAANSRPAANAEIRAIEP